jgi:DNA-binding GntR family transcriptional regulator
MTIASVRSNSNRPLSVPETGSGPDPTELARTTLGDEVYRVLWQRILDRRLRAGEKLSDLRLSDELGVSRTPVREALQRLVQDGIARAEPNRGFYVASFAPEDVEEVYELRAVLEAMALKLAAPHLSPTELRQDLAEMERFEHLIDQATSREDLLQIASEFLQSDRAFHRRLVERANRKRLATLVQGLWAQIAVFQEAGSFLPSLVRQSVAHHREIIHALLAGDVSTAVASLERHIHEVKGRVVSDVASTLDEHLIQSDDATDAKGQTE